MGMGFIIGLLWGKNLRKYAKIESSRKFKLYHIYPTYFTRKCGLS